MKFYDVIIVGSGPAGTFSAYGLDVNNVLMLDVGYRPKKSPELHGNLDELRAKTPDMFPSLIGENFESMHNIYRSKISYKLKAPYMTYILKNWQKLSPVKTDGFETMMSFATGGLANAWGAGVYQFNEDELKNFPLTESEIAPYYAELTKHIGISGTNDDLAESFGSVKSLLPSLERSGFFDSLLKRYRRLRHHKKFSNIKIGAPRLAILSQTYDGRQAYQYDRMDFFKPYNKAVYNPAFTLEKIIQENNNFTYKPGFLVLHYIEHEEHVEVCAQRIDDDTVHYFKAKKLILAAGALNTAKLVLKSNNDYETHLPIMDNPMVCVPMVDYKFIGKSTKHHDSPIAQLNLVYKTKEYGPIQASFYGSTGPLRTDITFGFPLSVKGNMAMTKYLAPAAGLAMIFFPGHLSPNNYIKLNQDNSLTISYRDEKKDQKIVRTLMTSFRKMGYLCLESLNQYPKIGNSLHYAGIFPMQKNPSHYQTDKNGKLHGTQRIYITDGACFTELPAKNLTFTIMANALRISRVIKGELS
jgi:choline dehydrogenase-like flavoprotein